MQFLNAYCLKTYCASAARESWPCPQNITEPDCYRWSSGRGDVTESRSLQGWLACSYNPHIVEKFEAYPALPCEGQCCSILESSGKWALFGPCFMEEEREPLRGQRLVPSPHGGKWPQNCGEALNCLCQILDNQDKETGHFGPLEITQTYQQLYWKDLPSTKRCQWMLLGLQNVLTHMASFNLSMYPSLYRFGRGN